MTIFQITQLTAFMTSLKFGFLFIAFCSCHHPVPTPTVTLHNSQPLCGTSISTPNIVQVWSKFNWLEFSVLVLEPNTFYCKKDVTLDLPNGIFSSSSLMALYLRPGRVKCFLFKLFFFYFLQKMHKKYTYR